MLYTTQNNWEQVVQFKRDIYDTDRLKCTEINILSDLNIKVRLYTAHILFWASLVAQRLKCLPPMQETWVRSLGQEDPLEKEMVTHSSILAWRIPRIEKPGRLQSTGLQSQTRLSDFTHSLIFCFTTETDDCRNKARNKPNI